MKSKISVRISMASLVLVLGMSSFGMSASAVGQSQVETLEGTAPAQTAQAPSTPGSFRFMERTGNQLQLNWDWVSGGVGTIHYELAYAGRTLVLNQYYPGYQLDVSGLDLSPGHSYSLRLWAVDELGVHSATPAQLTFETTPPTPPGGLALLSTRDGYPDMISFAFSSDNAGPIRTYEVFLNGEVWGNIFASSNEFSLYRLVGEAYKNPPRGPAALQLRALDQSFNPSRLSDPLTVVFP